MGAITCHLPCSRAVEFEVRSSPILALILALTQQKLIINDGGTFLFGLAGALG
jgi:hypothetical protein